MSSTAGPSSSSSLSASVKGATASSSSSSSTMVGRFDISQLPSLVKDGMTVQQEAIQRRKTCRFIDEAGKIIKLPRVAIATAMVFFHRFYAKHAFSEHDRFEVAVACLVLAAKTEEAPKKLNIVIIECHKLKIQGMKAGNRATTTSSSSSATPNLVVDVLDVKSEEFMKLKERILLLERVVLHTIGFELSIDHPYKFLVDQVRQIVITKPVIEFDRTSASSETAGLSTTEITKKLNTRLVQMSMNFANDSMQTSLCLQYDPKEIATACVYLACNFGKIRPVANKDWIEILDFPDVEALASICLQILELIAERKGSDTTITDTIRTYLDQIQKRYTYDTATGKSVAVTSSKPPSSGPDAKRQRTE